MSVNLQTVLHASATEEIEVHRLWDLESIGINEVNEVQDLLKGFSEESIKRRGHRYQVMLPWKNNKVFIEDDNFIGARVRSAKLRSKLVNLGKLNEYNGAINELLVNNYAELVNDSEREVNDRVYYMPHRPVFREDKDTTKLRVVFDASAHGPNSKSLNYMLEKGPNLNPELVNVLLNFRVGTIGITADIEKAFLQILLNNGDRDTHRFLWYDCNGDIKAYRMTRVTFGVTCSPFLLSAVIQKHLRENEGVNTQVVQCLQRSFYVDDLVVSVSDHNFAKRLKSVATQLLQGASMNLRKWLTNDQALNDKTEVTSLRKVLGVNWCVISDRLSVDLKSVVQYVDSLNTLATKRIVLQTIARIYDPFGFIGPFVIKLKILFQKIWKTNPKWDDLLQNGLSSEWTEWITQLKMLEDFSVPRCLFLNEIRQCQLHLFADASLQAYGTVAYVRSVDENGTINVMLLYSKNRVAPLKGCTDKGMTLPRLELTAALLAARLQIFIKRNLAVAITDCVMWTDSKIALHWINGDSNRWKPYVSNRVKEIQSLTEEISGWFHCPGTENLADLLTRGISAKVLEESKLRLEGPPWLREDKENWPDSPVDEENHLLIARSLINQEDLTTRNAFIDADKFSSFDRLLRVTAYVLRFINNIKCKNHKSIGKITVEEINRAEVNLIKDAQYNEYFREIKCLENKVVLPRDSKILTLNPFLDIDGLLRIGGRLQDSNELFDIKHPIILPKCASLNVSLINKVHRTLHHSGTNAILGEIRKRFWIIRARQLIKSTLARCIVCKKLRGKPATVPFAPLPRNRITEAKPFRVTGLDFAGPLYYKESGLQKAYVFLFTCAVTRALHLELVPSMNAETSILALKRFVARRGVPKIIYSDNAKTFKRVSVDVKIISEILDSHQLNDFANNYRIEWKFIVERAAWWGGFWERLVKSIKDALRASIGRFLLDRDQLTTVLSEIEATINARPLTYIGDDPKELLPLTPSHFLIGSTVATFPSIPGDINGSDLRRRWRQRMRTLGVFWKRWTAEYLLQLRGAHHNKSVNENEMNVGDVVLVHGSDSRRLLWKMGIIQEVYPGRDGKIRVSGEICKRYSNSPPGAVAVSIRD